MRIPTFPSIIRTFYTLSNYTTRASNQLPFQAISPFPIGVVYKSMPTIPFFGALFSSNTSQKMSYPVQKSDDEWQAVLDKGMSASPT